MIPVPSISIPRLTCIRVRRTWSFQSRIGGTISAIRASERSRTSSYRIATLKLFWSGMLERTSDLAVLAEIQQRVLAESVKPDSLPSVAISYAHRNQANMRRTVPPCVQGRGNDFADNRHSNRTQRIFPAVFAGEDNVRTPAHGARGSHQAQIRSSSVTRANTYSEPKENC